MSVKTLNMKSTTQRTNAQKLIKTQEELHKNTVEQIEQKQHTHMHIYIYIIYNIHILGRSWNEQTTSTNTKLEHHLPPRHFSKLRAKVTPAAAQAAASYVGLSPKS